MTKEEAFNISLPKWPQCVIKGERVTKEQAMDIIRKTDEFFIGGFGNNTEFNNEARKIVGMPPEWDYGKEHTNEEFNEYWKKMDEFREGQLDLNYLNNSWISCCWVGGPHGWCSPEGEIGYQNNIGKWPTVEEVYEDLKTMGKNFPYLNLTCTLLNCEESCYDENTKTLITMKLKNGRVTFCNPIPLDKLEYAGVEFGVRVLTNLSTECYFSLDEIKKWWGK